MNTTLDEIMEKRRGVCQDFTHLFCALARQNSIPLDMFPGICIRGTAISAIRRCMPAPKSISRKSAG